MQNQSTGIVATTIFEPTFLDGYLKNLERSGRSGETCIYIIPDKKTPESVYRAANAAGERVICPTLDEQDAFLKRCGIPTDFIPYNSDNRRNVGFLMALEAGCDVLISIDDDNYCFESEDFVGTHHVVGSSTNDPVVTSSDKWFNICTLLDGWNGPAIFPRGFPYVLQKASREIKLGPSSTPIRIAMNAGLWLDEPDVDAVFRLCRGARIKRFLGQSVVLGPEVWSPINTQNTGLIRDAALTYYYVRMGFPLKGLSIDRFGDILSGYLTQKVVKHQGDGIRVGTPIVDHRRTPHNLFKDLYHELAGIVLVEEFIPWLIETRLKSSNYLDSYSELAEAIAAGSSQFKGFIWDDGGRDFLLELARLIQTWIGVVRRWA